MYPNTSIYTSVGWFLTIMNQFPTLVPVLKTRPGSGQVPVNPNQAAFLFIGKISPKRQIKN